MVEFGPAAVMLTAALAAPTAAAEQGTPPISLVTEATPAEASYALEMVGGSNHSTQRGSVRLHRNERVVLLTARLGGAAGRDWRALLTVTPRAGEPYRIERRGS